MSENEKLYIIIKYILSHIYVYDGLVLSLFSLLNYKKLSPKYILLFPTSSYNKINLLRRLIF